MHNLLQNLTCLSQQLQSIDDTLQETNKKLECKSFISSTQRLVSAVNSIQDNREALKKTSMQLEFQSARLKKTSSNLKESHEKLTKASDYLNKQAARSHEAVKQHEQICRQIDLILDHYQKTGLLE